MSKSIVNCETGEIIVRELSDDELAQQKIDEATAKIESEIRTEKAQARAVARQAILDRLGLTEEEAKLLLG